MPGVFLVGQDASLVKMNPAAPLLEAELQELIATHPTLLGGCTAENEGDERSLLLVRREMGVPDQENGNNRWSMDHFFIDQSAVPTLVEVKRSKNPQIRREIVGQLLDYAANGVVYWPLSEIKDQFLQQWGPNAASVMESFLEGAEFAEEEDFWQAVENNLRRGNIRLVFVADELPPQLRRVIEFLNEQMKDVEVLGVELPQFKALDEKQRVIAPSVIGRTSAAALTKGRVERRSYEQLDAVVTDFRALPEVPAVSNRSGHYRQIYIPGIRRGIHFEFLQFARKGILCEFHVETAPNPDLDAAMRELDGTSCAGSKIEYFQRGRTGALRVIPRDQQSATVVAETMREFIRIAQPKLLPILA